MPLFCLFSPQNSFPGPSGSNPGFVPFPEGLRWNDRDLRLRITGVPPLNRGKSLQSFVSTSVCWPRYQGQTQGFHLRAGFGRLGGILILQEPFWSFGLLNFLDTAAKWNYEGSSFGMTNVCWRTHCLSKKICRWRCVDEGTLMEVYRRWFVCRYTSIKVRFHDEGAISVPRYINAEGTTGHGNYQQQRHDGKHNDNQQCSRYDSECMMVRVQWRGYDGEGTTARIWQRRYCNDDERTTKLQQEQNCQRGWYIMSKIMI